MSSHAATALPPEEMQLLAWKFLDGCASQAEQKQLAGCLTEHQAAREIYLQCVQLHVDLLAHFGGLQPPKLVDKLAKPAMPVLPAVQPLPLMNAPSPF